MTTTVTTAAATPPDTSLGALLRRHRALLLVGLALVAAVVFAALGSADDGYRDDADPQNSKDNGARALAQVLGDEGVDVDVVRSADALDDAGITPGTTVVVTGVHNLGPGTAARLREAVAGADLVLVEPRFGGTLLFGEDDSSTSVERVRSRGRCDDARFDGLRIDVEGATVYPASAGSCFPDRGGAVLAHPADGLWFLGAEDLITNEHVLRADNAAVALRLLGAHDRLVWYVPDPADVIGDGVSVSSLLPRWLKPGLLLLAAAVLALLLWRGRRLGRLAVEPLPVTVTAIETTQSRGRLYRRAGDRAHAAAALRRAARRRLADGLGLPRGAADDVPALVRDLAPHTDLDEHRLNALLGTDSPAPGSDHDLIRLADDLADLTREVRRS